MLSVVAPGSAAPITLRGGSGSVLSSAGVAAGSASAGDVRAGRVRFVPFAQYRPAGWPVSLWLRFSLSSGSERSSPWLLIVPRLFESADFYHADGTHEANGMYVPYALRANGLYVPSFTMRSGDFTGAPLYLHVVYYPEQPLAVRFHTEHWFFLWNEPYRIVEGIFLGVMLALAMLNFFVFGVMRDRSGLFYAAYLVMMALNEIVSTGIGEQYLWPAAGASVRVLSIGTAFSSITLFLFFSRALLQTREEARRCDIALLVSYGIYAVLQIAQIAISGGQVLVPFVLGVTLAGMIVTIVVGAIRLRGGYRPARFFILAFAPSTIGVFANLWYDAYFPPGNWFWAANGVELGTMLQSLVLSFSVIDRLRLLQSETNRTRSELSAVSAHAKKMQALALYDPLTGLSNRIRFTDELSRAVARRAQDGKGFAVLFCDLDGFKAINDLFGHRFGDDVLKIVAERMACSLRGEDMIARLGGDEFAVLLEFVSSPLQADHVAEMLAHLLDEPIVLDGKIMPIGISVGRALFPQDGSTIDELLHAADLRMYQMKQARKATA